MCPDAPAAEGRKHVFEVVVLEHGHELNRRTTQGKYWEREKGTSHPGYRAATAERLVKEEKDTDPGNMMIS